MVKILALQDFDHVPSNALIRVISTHFHGSFQRKILMKLDSPRGRDCDPLYDRPCPSRGARPLRRPESHFFGAAFRLTVSERGWSWARFSKLVAPPQETKRMHSALGARSLGRITARAVNLVKIVQNEPNPGKRRRG